MQQAVLHQSSIAHNLSRSSHTQCPALACRQGLEVLSSCSQADFDPSTRARMEQGIGQCIEGKSFGFKVPASLQLQSAAAEEVRGPCMTTCDVQSYSVPGVHIDKFQAHEIL